jgi:hypothetical protein
MAKVKSPKMKNPAGLNDKAAQEKRGIGTRLDPEAKCIVEFRADRKYSSFKQVTSETHPT